MRRRVREVTNLLSDQAAMNWGSSAGTIEYLVRPRISGAHTAATTVVEGPAGARLLETDCNRSHRSQDLINRMDWCRSGGAPFWQWRQPRRGKPGFLGNDRLANR